MEKFIDILKKYDDFVAIEGASSEQIANAEKVLQLEFNDEYREYLRECGAAAANGHELTGICKSKRLGIVDATLKARNSHPNVPVDMYLIEDLGIDHVMIWQNKEGEIFQTIEGSTPENLGISLSEYISQ